MTERGWSIQRIRAEHQRDHFDRGLPDLDEFLQKYARQNDEKGLGRTFVAVRGAELIVRGYYTCAAAPSRRPRCRTWLAGVFLGIRSRSLIWAGSQ
ncbi:MAG: hypothetical protein AB1505_20600 [Candidatus Latescibacterota bacterium]